MRWRTSKTLGLLVLCLSAAALSGCALGPASSGKGGGGSVGSYKVGKPYQVKGIWYYPKESFSYDETGIASWYGPGFHAEKTANGETFDQNTLTAAHKTLQMPSVARVTNLENGKSLVVRVNDRGPFANGRIIDLSRRSAQMLGFANQGTARVRVQVLRRESLALKSSNGRGGTMLAALQDEDDIPRGETLPPQKSSEKPVGVSKPVLVSASNLEPQEVKVVPVRSSNNIYVQAGSFGRKDNALRLQTQLTSVGKPQIQEAQVGGQTLYRVRLGPLPTVAEADRVLEAVYAAGQTGAKVIVD